SAVLRDTRARAGLGARRVAAQTWAELLGCHVAVRTAKPLRVFLAVLRLAEELRHRGLDLVLHPLEVLGLVLAHVLEVQLRQIRARHVEVPLLGLAAVAGLATELGEL